MTCHEIVTKLLAYQLQLTNALDLSVLPELAMDTVNEYSFVTIDIHRSGKHFAQIRFELNDEVGTLAYVHCDDRSAEERFAKKIVLENWQGWRSPSIVNLPYPDEVLQSLQTADHIAGLTMNCTAGDSYRPGNFSTVSVNRDRIELKQINHMNARSLDHKNNYSLRDLVFTIPFEANTVKNERLQTYQVGNMVVTFSDRSSENNRTCGRRVIEELKRLHVK